MLIMYAFCPTAGLLLSIGGAYQHIFMSEDKISEASVRFGNTYLYVDFILYFILGFRSLPAVPCRASPRSGTYWGRALRNWCHGC